MSVPGYAAWSVTAGEQPTTAYWNILGSNDAAFNTFLSGANITNSMLSTAAGDVGGAWTTYTPTTSGWAATPTASARYIQQGKQVTIEFYITGTSNNTISSMALPVAAKNGGSISGMALELAVDAGVNTTTAGKSFLDASTDANNVYFYKNVGGTTFSNSGTKSVRGMLIYEAA